MWLCTNNSNRPGKIHAVTAAGISLPAPLTLLHKLRYENKGKWLMLQGYNMWYEIRTKINLQRYASMILIYACFNIPLNCSGVDHWIVRTMIWQRLNIVYYMSKFKFWAKFEHITAGDSKQSRMPTPSPTTKKFRKTDVWKGYHYYLHTKSSVLNHIDVEICKEFKAF